MYVSLDHAVQVLNCLKEGEKSNHPHASSILRARQELAEVMAVSDPTVREDRLQAVFGRWRTRSRGTPKTEKVRSERDCWLRLLTYTTQSLSWRPDPEVDRIILKQYVYQREKG